MKLTLLFENDWANVCIERKVTVCDYYICLKTINKYLQKHYRYYLNRTSILPLKGDTFFKPYIQTKL